MLLPIPYCKYYLFSAGTGGESYTLTAWICEHKPYEKRSRTQAAAVLPTKNVNSGKGTELRLTPVLLWKPLSSEFSTAS